MQQRLHIFQTAILALLLCVAGTGCQRITQPNILLITLDTTRADRLGCYGYSRAMTMAIDRLAAEGVLFENVFANAPLTTPSHASILTGLLPPEHGIRINGEGTLPTSVPTVAEQLGERGYRTGAFIGAFVLDRRFGLNRGFEVYDDDMRGGYYSDTELYRFRLGEKVTDAALAWLQQHAHDRFFCWVHLFDPHVPYDPHPEMFGSRFLDSPYDGEIAYVDVQVDRLLRFLEDRRITRKTVVIIAGDHGEGLDEHDERTHGYFTYNSTLRVPLLFFWPARWKTARRIAAPVMLADLAPTMLELAGRKPPTSVSGKSLLPLIEGQAFAERDLYAETELPWRGHGWSPQYVLIRWPWKYVHTARPELFNLETDPHESTNLVDAASDKAALLASDLVAWRATLAPRGTAGPAVLSEAERRTLESLGYAAGREPDQTASEDLSGLTDMKDRIRVISLVLDAKEAMARDQKERALALIREAVQTAPEQLSYREYLAAALHADGQTDAALEEIRHVLESEPARVSAWAKQAVLLASAGRVQDAWKAVDQLKSIAPDSPTTLRVVSDLYMAEGRADEAIPLLLRVVELRPDHVSSRIALANAFEKAGRFDEARRERELITKLDPTRFRTDHAWDD